MTQYPDMERQAGMEGMDASKWDALIERLPNTHVLQTWEWAQVKSKFGWQPHPTVWHDREGEVAAAAMVLERSIEALGSTVKLRVMYVPKGPLLRDWRDPDLRQQVLHDLRVMARSRGNIFVKIDPDVRLAEGTPGNLETDDLLAGKQVVEDLKGRGWRFSDDQIQFRNTVLVDLRPSEDTMLSNMKQKTRYNVRLAGRRGVTVRVGTQTDLDMLYRMYVETSLRDGFVIREEAYYKMVWQTFMEAGMAEPLIAEVEGEAVAAVVIFRFAGEAWYLFGMSRPLHREKMPNHLLQWEAMRRAKAAGCQVYDLWGAPNVFDESDSLWGVYRFKEGFGGKVVRHIGAWDLPVRGVSYRLYTQVLPQVLNVMRRRGRARTEEGIL
jgi:lipid II:glycine glycyltransferase (peptidoglycan interpeptide bridge formation enzyme)